MGMEIERLFENLVFRAAQNVIQFDNIQLALEKLESIKNKIDNK